MKSRGVVVETGEGLSSAAAGAMPWDEKERGAPSEVAPAIPAVGEAAFASVAGHLLESETEPRKPWRHPQ